MLSRSHGTLAGLAIVAGLAACSPHVKPPPVTAQNAAIARSVGERLAAQEREQTKEHRDMLARLISANLASSHEDDRWMQLKIAFANKTKKTIKALELGLEVDDDSGRALGRCELRTSQSIEANSKQTIAFNFPYAKFGSNTGTVREALGQPKHYLLEVKEIKYTDGSDAGYDD